MTSTLQVILINTLEEYAVHLLTERFLKETEDELDKEGESSC